MEVGVYVLCEQLTNMYLFGSCRPALGHQPQRVES